MARRPQRRLLRRVRPPTATATTAPAADGETFGDLAWPCGPGDGANADDGSVPGVTAESISIATGDDAGYASSPGLNHQMTDAINALAAKCNELGGINGRQIEVNYYDAAITNVATAIQGACDGNNFFLVGEGWSFDFGAGGDPPQLRPARGADLHGERCVRDGSPTCTRACRTRPTRPRRATSPMIAELFPEEIKAVATLGGNFSATQETIDKVRAVAPEFGWSFVGDRIEFDIFSPVTDWTPFVKQIQDLRRDDGRTGPARACRTCRSSPRRRSRTVWTCRS